MEDKNDVTTKCECECPTDKNQLNVNGAFALCVILIAILLGLLIKEFGDYYQHEIDMQIKAVEAGLVQGSIKGEKGSYWVKSDNK